LYRNVTWERSCKALDKGRGKLADT